MQVPAPFEYERATSVEHAIGLLERLGSEARLIAGGHSLLPMMKLRLANLEYVIDINDLHDELGYVRVGADEVRIGAMTRHRELLESAGAGRALPDLRRRRAGDRRPGGAQPRDARRLAVPGRPVGGPDGRVHDARRQLRHPRHRRRAGRHHGRVPPRPLRDGRGARRDPHRDPHPGPSRRLQCLRQGRAPGRRLGGDVGRRRGLDGRRRSSPMPASGWRRWVRTPAASRPSPRRCAASRHRRSSTPGPARSPPRTAHPSPTTGGRPTTSGISPTS